MYVISIGAVNPSDDTTVALTEELKRYADDVDGDGEIVIDYTAILHDPENKETDTSYANEQKYVSLLGEGHSRIILMDKDHYEATLLDEQFDGFLTDISQYTDSAYKKYAVPVSETKLFGKVNIFDDYYVVLTQIGGGKKESGINLDRYNAGIALVEGILK